MHTEPRVARLFLLPRCSPRPGERCRYVPNQMPRSKHTIFAPVYGLELGSLVNDEIRIGRVMFVSASKIPRIRKRLGLYDTVANLRAIIRNDRYELLGNAPVYAVVINLRDPEDRDIKKELRLIKDAYWLLASSFAYHIRRKNAALSLTTPIASNSILDTSVFGPNSFTVNNRFNAAFQPNRCDGYWKQNAENHHFFALQKVVDKTYDVQGNWRKSIVRAATLFGQSFLAKHLAEAFMYNMIAIETLLSVQGDKFPSSLVDRIVALFGWMTNEDSEPWKLTIDRLYKLRCGYVHDGKHGSITGDDLFEADTILQNLLANVCKNTKYIRCKADIAALSERVAAMQVLGLPIKRREKFTHGRLVKNDQIMEDYNDDSAWNSG